VMRFNMTTIRNSERDLGRLGWPARTRPEAQNSNFVLIFY
jgi:hypothetical protein